MPPHECPQCQQGPKSLVTISSADWRLRIFWNPYFSVKLSSKQLHDWIWQFYPALIRTPAILHLDTTFQIFATSCPVRDRFDFTHILLVSPPRLFLQALLLYTCSVSLTKAWLLEIRWRSDLIKQNYRYFMQRSTRSNDPSSVQLNRTCLYQNNTTKHILNI